MRDVKWAIGFARNYRQETQAGVALRLLADEALLLRRENEVLRELIGQVWPARAETVPTDGSSHV